VVAATAAVVAIFVPVGTLNQVLIFFGSLTVVTTLLSCWLTRGKIDLTLAPDDFAEPAPDDFADP